MINSRHFLKRFPFPLEQSPEDEADEGRKSDRLLTAVGSFCFSFWREKFSHIYEVVSRCLESKKKPPDEGLGRSESLFPSSLYFAFLLFAVAVPSGYR
jgi:hypothetical protein